LGGTVQVAQQHPAGGAGGARRRVDQDPLHRRQVDHQHAVADRVPGHGVPAAADRHLQVALAGEADGCHHVVGAGAAGDQRRPPVDRAVPELACLVVPLLSRLEQRTTERGAQPGQRRAVDRGTLGPADRCGYLSHHDVPHARRHRRSVSSNGTLAAGVAPE